MGDPGCGGGGDPDLRETGTGMWSCLSALFEEILCTVSDYNPVEFLFFNANSPLRFTFPLYLP